MEDESGLVSFRTEVLSGSECVLMITSLDMCFFCGTQLDNPSGHGTCPHCGNCTSCGD